MHNALHLDPLDLGLNMNVADLLILQRDFQSAISQLTRTLDLDSDFQPARLRLAMALALAGEADTAVDTLGSEQSDDPKYCEYAAVVAGMNGHRDHALNWFECLKTSAALDLRRAVGAGARRSGQLRGSTRRLRISASRSSRRQAPSSSFGVAPSLDRLRADPRMLDCYRSIGLTPRSTGKFLRRASVLARRAWEHAAESTVDQDLRVEGTGARKKSVYPTPAQAQWAEKFDSSFPYVCIEFRSVAPVYVRQR